ncbi:MAG TPA: 2-C-methyl-D-erythritol 4-phosphate cytidylyltransferase [Acidimicrobiia bacterium]|nr:2-C-methyl-D-erythritol 4-phosphate cytidylyltransferase [Acidimicrobiia bacterium]
MIDSGRDAKPSAPRTETVSALILAGGSGERLGGKPKALLRAGDETLLARVVSQARDHASEVIVGLPAGLVATGKDILGSRAEVIAGGETRQATFLETFARSTGDIVVIHDVARPFASARLWMAVIDGARDHGGAAPVVPLPVRDSLAMREGSWLGSPVEREGLVSIQTPYAFRRPVLSRALSTAAERGWMESSVTTLVTRSGQRVLLVPGDPENTKVTFQEDWDEAEDRF